MSRLGAAAKPTKQQQQAAKRARTNKSEEPDTTSREPATKEYKSREIIEDDDRCVERTFRHLPSVFRIRIHFIRFWIQHFRLNTVPVRIRIQGFDDQKSEKIYS
jgi:hypothetical protein